MLIIALAVTFAAAEGFYKDLWMDGGTGLTHRTRLYAAESLGLAYEYLARDDSTLLNYIVIGNQSDANGALLYPDGAPRFRCIYTNGGDAGRHGRAMTAAGRQRIRGFVGAGGSYSGSCAGAYLASLSNQDSGTVEIFYHIWRGRTRDAGLRNAYVGNTIPPGSRLLEYSDFGGDLYIDSLYVNGGPYANEAIGWPAGTDVLLRYDSTGHPGHDRCAAWSHKPADTTGRIVLLGSHPEGWPFGERLELMRACLAFALDGVAGPRAKASLARGVPRAMTEPSGGDPARARIGDRQYHHFRFDVPPGAANLRLAVAADNSTDLHLFLDTDTFAIAGTAPFSDTTPGGAKTLRVPFPPPGRWFAGVKLASSVATFGDSCFLYRDSLGVLDGIAYSVVADWDSSAAIAATETPDGRCRILPTLFRTTCRIELDDISTPVRVFDALGRLVASDQNPRRLLGATATGWRFTPGPELGPGVYLVVAGNSRPLRITRLR